MTQKQQHKNILCIHQGWELYGSDRSFLLNLTLFKKLLGDAYHLDVVIPKNGVILDELKKITPNVYIENMGKIERQEAKSKPFKSLLKILKSAPHCYRRMKNANIVYINTIVPFGYLFTSLFFRKKVILHVREIPNKTIARVFKWWFMLCRINLIFNSQNTCNAFGMQTYKRGFVLLNAVDAIEMELKKETDFSKINLLLIGRINGWKGQDFFLDSFSKLEKKFKDKFQIRIVGDTPEGQEFYKERLVSQLKDLDLNTLVELISFTQNPATHYNWADILIAPSTLPEPFGRVAVESFSVQTPVIAANHGGLNEIINEKNGWHFEPSNTFELLTILRDVCTRPTQIIEKGIAARLSFEQNYSVEVYEKKFNLYITNLIEKL